MEEIIEMPLQLPVFCRVFSCHLVGFFQDLLYRWRVLADLLLVPALLEIISLVCVTTITVTESDVFDVV